MSSRAPAKQEKAATKPRHKMQGHTSYVRGVICLPDEQRIMTCSWDHSLRVWDLKGGMQVGDAWEDEGSGWLYAIALSPDGKTVASGSLDGAVKLWDIDTGKVIKKWTGHTNTVRSICWSPDGGRVVSGSEDNTFRVWDVESGKTIIGPIKAGDDWVYAVCYSPDGTMIATGGDNLKIWDANTGELLKTLQEYTECLAWTSDGKTLITAGSDPIKKFDTATWTETGVLDGHSEHLVSGISLSPNERVLASVSWDETARLWDLQTNQPIGPPLHHEDMVKSATFSADGKFLATACDNDIYTWDVFAIIKDAGLYDLLSDNVNTVRKSGLHADATRRQPPQIDGARRLPPGFFDDFSTSRGTPSHGRCDHPTTAPRRSRSSPFSWPQKFVSDILRRSHVPPVVEVPLTAGKPRNYHARGKKAASSSRPSNPHTTQQNSGLPAATGTAVASGTNSPPDITIRRAGWRARLMLWVCCLPIQNVDGQH